MASTPSSPSTPSMPSIAVEKVCNIVVRAREWEVRYAANPVDGSNESDDRSWETLVARRDDPAQIELVEFIGALNDDEKAELVALVWLGRGDYTSEEWDEAVRMARERSNHSTARYLLGIPLLPDLLQEGLAAFNLDCTEIESEHL